MIFHVSIVVILMYTILRIKKSKTGKKTGEKATAVTRIRTWVFAATTQSTYHYTITAHWREMPNILIKYDAEDDCLTIGCVAIFYY